MNRQLFRLLDCMQLMQDDNRRLRMFTLTIPEFRLPLKQVHVRWRDFVNSRFWRSCIKTGGDYLMVYEPHPSGHGWHIHAVCNFFIPWRTLQSLARSCGFGHTDIEICDMNTAYYLSKYLSKAKRSRDCESYNVRLTGVSRRLTALRDCCVSSPSIDYIRSNFRRFREVPFSNQCRYLYFRWLMETTGIQLGRFR